MKRNLLTATAIGAVLALAVVLYQVGLETPAENALAPTAGQAPAPEVMEFPFELLTHRARYPSSASSTARGVR